MVLEAELKGRVGGGGPVAGYLVTWCMLVECMNAKPVSVDRQQSSIAVCSDTDDGK